MTLPQWPNSPSIGGWRPGPVVLAAIAAGILAVFGIGAIVLPPLLSSSSKGKASGGTPAQAAPPAAVETSLDPTAEPTATGTASPKASGRAGATPSVAGNPRFEDQVLALVNNERRKAKCDPLRMDDKLRTAARGHSIDMAVKNFFDHTGSDGSSPVDRMRSAGYSRGLSENIARGPNSPQDVMKAWMHSRDDRANIVDCNAKALGVGLAYRGRTPFWTQNFGDA